MEKLNVFATTTHLFALTAHAGRPTEILKKLSEEETSAIPAILVENVVSAFDERSEVEVNASLITVASGPIYAPYTTYLKVFDPIPQSGGKTRTFKVFMLPNHLNSWPKQMKIDYARSGKTIFVGFDATYFDSVDANQEAKFAKGRMVTKLSIATPVSEGALDSSAEFSIRK